MTKDPEDPNDPSMITAYGMPPMKAGIPYDGPPPAPAYGMPPMRDSPRLPEARVRRRRVGLVVAIGVVVIAAAVAAVIVLLR